MKSQTARPAPAGNDLKDERAPLLAAIRRLELPGAGVSERMALAEACFRLAVMPGTPVDESIELMRRALVCDAYHPKLFFHLGRLLHLNGDPRAAILEYRRALKLAPRSHRALVHLALALNDAGNEERRLGLRTFVALAGCEEDVLAGIVTEVDELIAAWSGRKKKTATTAAEDSKWDGAGNGKCRWRGLWKVFLLQELSRPKPPPKRTAQLLDGGRELVDGAGGAAEYVTACLLIVVNRRDSCRELEARLRTAELADQKDRPAVRLAAAVCELGAAEDPDAFVDRASALLDAQQIPAELVCCLHYCWYAQQPDTDSVRAAALIDRYPVSMRGLLCFRELRIAILDYHAQIAWTGGRVDRARILWQECLAQDPTRMGLAHNLAVAATKEKAEERYVAAWDRAIELRYLLAAAASDPRLELDDRLRMHGSFAQQSRVRFLKSENGARGEAREREMQAWMEDGDAFLIWLREWELYYLNSRLRFHSPMHLLGVGLDCTEEDAEAGRRTLVRQFELCFQERGWAGTQVFRQLAETLSAEACAQAKDPMQRRRDPYFELESTEARTLAKEATERGFLLFDLLRLAVNSSSENVHRAGLEAARYLLNMPWRSLEAAWRAGGGAADDKLAVIFASYVIKLARQAGPRLAGLKLQVVTACSHGAPEVHELRLFVCGLLLDEGRHRDAYEAALAGFALLDKGGEADSKALERQYMACLDRAALAEMPENLRQPSLLQVKAFAAEVRRVLAEYPKAGGLRLTLAQLLIQSSDEDPTHLSEATAILHEAIDLLLTEEQVREAQRWLERAGAKSEAAEALSSVRKLLASAAEKARTAVEDWRTDRTPAKARQALRQLDQARDEAVQAERVAAEAKLASAAAKARSMLDDLERLREEIAR